MRGTELDLNKFSLLDPCSESSDADFRYVTNNLLYLFSINCMGIERAKHEVNMSAYNNKQQAGLGATFVCHSCMVRQP